ncbi:MAG: protein kinase [Acidobacteria bacterium]|nr:protein kinase [Acidobacteriota bacterium]
MTPPQPPELDHIGRYRIVARLGAGGMGTVYKAYDEQLDRWVALKKIHAENAEDARARERLRREARAAASLKHPAIVSIYDILEAQGSDWIVMELVEGDTLAQRLEEGSLDLPHALRLTWEIAEGLSEAHAKGIVHRDLKAENVIVTPAGHAKILDFGLAKKIWHDSSEPTLSLEGKVLGTVRSMSPEQALGGKLDHRSDLFSLGTMLYEALTGTSPFLAGSPVETLTRVCTFQQPSARELNSELPEELSSLVDRLLEKSPEKRPRNAAQVAVALQDIHSRLPGVLSPLVSGPRGSVASQTGLPPTVIDGGLAAHISSSSAPTVQRSIPVGSALVPAPRSHLRMVVGIVIAVLVFGAASAYWLLHRPVPHPIHVAVMTPVVKASENVPESHLLGPAMKSALTRGVMSLENLSPMQADQASNPTAAPPVIARELAADEYLTSSLNCRGRSCVAAFSRVDTLSGAVLDSQSFEVPADNLSSLARAVIRYLSRSFPDHPARAGARVMDVREEDYSRYLRLRRAFDEREEGITVREIASEAAKIHQTSPRFLEAYLLEADARGRLYQTRRDLTELDESFQLINEARRLAPNDPEMLQRQFFLALQTNRLDEADRIQRELENLEPGDAINLVNRAHLLKQRGQREEALALMRRAADQRPSWTILRDLSFMESQEGNVIEARRVLDELLERSPSNPEALSRLAQLELASGDVSKAAKIYEQLVQAQPTMPHLHTNLGLARMLQGNFERAAVAFEESTSLSPNTPVDQLNLADAYELLGRSGDSRRVYERVVELCDKEANQEDPELISLRAQALAHLGRSEEAVTAIQRALQLSPNNPSTAFEAALVFTLTGQQLSAVVNARKALAGGFERRWFKLPWFEPLDKNVEFAALLKEPESDASTPGRPPTKSSGGS